MSTGPFVHLHCHSHFSLLDGASPIPSLVQRAKQLNMNALALTDHGNLHGALEFYQKARDEGINPILGYEAYMAPGSRFAKDAAGNQEASYHLTLLAQNRAGFKNLLKLASAAYLEGFYRKPRIDRQLLEQHNEGILCLSGCVSGEFSRAILRGGDPKIDLDEAIQIAQWFHGIFGDRYYVEIQNNGLEMQRIALQGAVEVANRMGFPLVATSDAHYVYREDAEAQDVLLCINTGKFRTDTNRLKMEGDQFYLRSPQEMYDSFSGLDEAVRQSQLIADRVDIELDIGKRHFPTYTAPDGVESAQFLRDLCVEGLTRRYAGREDHLSDGELTPPVTERLDHELSVIDKLGFSNYFLIVWDFVRFAKEHDIPASARGSAVGSLVAYALGLSHVCPLDFDLLFERFLDESRKEAPDIDIDFCKNRRGEVIQYVKDKYGAANVAQIGTFGTLAARAAIRDVGRALSWPIPRVDSIVAMVPDTLGITLDAALDQSADLKHTYEKEHEVKELIDLARKIEGLARNLGTHAAAVVIADKPLVEYVPLCNVQGKDEVITQWAMGDVEAAGLLKMDFLGLGNLTTLAKAVDLIEQTTGRRVDPHRFPLDDPQVFELLCRGETKGIFQLESGGIRDLLQRLKPDHFRDIIAVNALYRPGPLEGGMVNDYIQVKHGRKQAHYKHPVMREILEETHGVMVYQEQVMRILNRLGDIALPDAYSCIKAIGKKKLADIARFREQFVGGAVSRGLTKKDAADLFDMVEKFAGYGFNKSHSTAYALIAYMTAYLKVHHPVEFMAALLSGDIPHRNFKRKDSLVEHLDDCRRMDVEVVPPDVNTSQGDFIVADGKIYFGLSAIKGCGSQAAAALGTARTEGGPFASLFDICERVDPTVVNRTALESLIKGGALDSLRATRAQWTHVLDRALQGAAAAQADRRSGQRGLFEDLDDDNAAGVSVQLPSVPEWPEKECLQKEKEVLGFYLSSHPLAEHEEQLSTYCTHTSREVSALSPRTEIILGGMLSAIRLAHTRTARPGQTDTKYAMFDLEDHDGMIRCILWPELFARYGHLVTADAILVARGTVDKRPDSEDANLIIDELIPLDELDRRFTRGVMIRVIEEEHGEEALEKLHEVLRAYPGECELRLLLSLADETRVCCTCEAMRVRLEPEMRRRVDALLGTGNFRLITSAPNGSKEGRSGGARPSASSRHRAKAHAR